MKIAYLKSKISEIALNFMCFGMLLFLCYLLNMRVNDIQYFFLLYCFIIFVWNFFGYVNFKKRYLNAVNRKFDKIIPRNKLEEAYLEIIKELQETNISVATLKDKTSRELEEYYTLWVHQIKTPISAMNVILQQKPNYELENELFKIEKYVDLVLCYVRSEDAISDFVFKECNLYEIMQAVIRKNSKTFIHQKTTLILEDFNLLITSDEKWIRVILEQLLTNALKYTPKGSICIYGDGKSIYIKDSGIGIAKEDLPRIFEKGFTGYNGREHKKSTGIGLFICKKIADKLNCQITITSEINKGTLAKVFFMAERVDK